MAIDRHRKSDSHYLLVEQSCPLEFSLRSKLLALSVLPIGGVLIGVIGGPNGAECNPPREVTYDSDDEPLPRKWSNINDDSLAAPALDILERENLEWPASINSGLDQLPL